jgi:outer membrane protein OmpA-like peptidoglycan-associated protein
MHARLASGVFLALGFADLAFLNLLLAPRLAVRTARPAAREIAAEVARPPAPAPAPPTAAAAAEPAAGRAEPPAAEPGPAPVPDVLFALSSEQITSVDAAFALADVARALRAHPARRVRLRGHADRLGAPAFNQALSRQRAQAVRHFLVARGAPPERIDIEAVGDAEPADPGDGFLAWARNRRVQVLWQ